MLCAACYHIIVSNQKTTLALGTKQAVMISMHSTQVEPDYDALIIVIAASLVILTIITSREPTFDTANYGKLRGRMQETLGGPATPLPGLPQRQRVTQSVCSSFSF